MNRQIMAPCNVNMTRANKKSRQASVELRISRVSRHAYTSNRCPLHSPPTETMSREKLIRNIMTARVSVTDTPLSCNGRGFFRIPRFFRSRQ